MCLRTNPLYDPVQFLPGNLLKTWCCLEMFHYVYIWSQSEKYVLGKVMIFNTISSCHFVLSNRHGSGHKMHLFFFHMKENTPNFYGLILFCVCVCSGWYLFRIKIVLRNVTLFVQCVPNSHALAHSLFFKCCVKVFLVPIQCLWTLSIDSVFPKHAD